MGLREHILQREDSPRERLHVDEWDADVWVRTMSGTERDDFEAAMSVQKGKKHSVNLRNVRARLVQICAANEDGSPIFLPGDIAALGEKSAKALDKVFAVAMRLNGFSDSDIEDIAKNS